MELGSGTACIHITMCTCSTNLFWQRYLHCTVYYMCVIYTIWWPRVLCLVINALNNLFYVYHNDKQHITVRQVILYGEAEQSLFEVDNTGQSHTDLANIHFPIQL